MKPTPRDPTLERRRRLNEPLRHTFIEGAEQDSRPRRDDQSDPLIRDSCGEGEKSYSRPMALDIKHDPVLRLIPEEGMPDAFLRLPPDEQARRGRLWITLFGMGYEPIYAWWFALSDESDIGEAFAKIAEVPDDHFPAMMQGRLKYEAAKAIQPDIAQ